MVLSFFAQAQVVNQQTNQHVLDEISQILEQEYVLTDNIPTIVKALKQLGASESFQKIKTSQELADSIKHTLQKFDGHLSITWQNPNAPKNSTVQKEGWFTKLSRKNGGFNKIEVLEGNIGYIDFWGFDHVNQCTRRKVVSVMALLEDTDALIIDLRNNGGGDPEMIQLITSYFFDKPVHLNSFESRKKGRIAEFWTTPKVDGKKRLNTPIYLLTSDKTFSAAEEFAYNLKHLKRAKIIGEPTKGGANPVHYFNIEGQFRASIPTAMAVNPITGSNWEGVGVQPDIKIPAKGALNLAYKLALEQVNATVDNAYQQAEIKEQLSTFADKG